MRLINEGMAEHGMTIRADFQTMGKGQHGNSWLAEESKNLLFTYILDTKGFQLQDQFLLNTFACLSVAEYLMTKADMSDIHIKWPNDIYADNKKIAGILIENIIRGTTWTHAIIGVGLNVNQTHFPDMNWATSMQIERGKSYKINLIMKDLLKIMNHNFRKFEQTPDSMLIAYNNLLYKVSSEIMFTKNHEFYRGTLMGTDRNGLLQISVDGKTKSFKHKEIELILG
jgi:BirA family biotin operon repressor/biotin-[acetyl-CoA-carboxylase] ligase